MKISSLPWASAMLALALAAAVALAPTTSCQSPPPMSATSSPPPASFLGGAPPPGLTSYCHGQACQTSADCNTQYCDCTAGYAGVLGCYYKTPP